MNGDTTLECSPMEEISTWLSSDIVSGCGTTIKTAFSDDRVMQPVTPPSINGDGWGDDGNMLCHDQDGLLLNWLKAEEGNGLLSEREEKPHVHIEVKEFSPDWDYTEGGAKVLIIGAPLEVNGTQYMCCFDRTQVPADVIQPGSLPFSPPPPLTQNNNWLNLIFIS